MLIKLRKDIYLKWIFVKIKQKTLTINLKSGGLINPIKLSKQKYIKRVKWHYWKQKTFRKFVWE